jgi:hypothetical protein
MPRTMRPGAVPIWNGHQFPGHWSWIYVARNDPGTDTTHIWQWIAQQRR